MPHIDRLEEVVIAIDISNARQRFRNISRIVNSNYDQYLLMETLTKVRKRVVIGDYKGPRYKDIKVPPIIANGQLVYAAQKNNEKWIVNCGGNEGPEHFGIRNHRLPKSIDLFLKPNLGLHLSTESARRYKETLQAQNPALGFLTDKIVYVAIDDGGLLQIRTYHGGKFYGDINPKFKSVYFVQEFQGKIAYFGEVEEGGVVKTILMVGLNKAASINRNTYNWLTPSLKEVDGRFVVEVHCERDAKREIPFILS